MNYFSLYKSLNLKILYTSKSRMYMLNTDKKLFLLTHNELGDLINHCGMIRYFRTIYNEVKIACRSDYIKQFEYMFDDDKNITFHPTARYTYNGSDLIPSHEMNQIMSEYDEVVRIGYHNSAFRHSDYTYLPFVFYDMAKVPYNVFWDYYNFRETSESLRLYNILKEHNIDKYVFIHNTISKIGIIMSHEDIKYKIGVDYNDTLFICIDYNIYSPGHKFYDIANEFVMKYVLDYTKIIENAEYVILSDSCFLCLSLHIPIKTKECYYVNARYGNGSYSYIFEERFNFPSSKGLPVFRRL
jgi:hypothetical protein